MEAVAPPKAAADADAKDQPKDDGEYRVTLQIDIAPDAAPGPHPLRLVAPGGVSNRLYLQIHQDPVIAESSQPHQQPATAQPVTVPVVVNGTIGRHGELDYYSLEASRGQEVAFEVIFSMKPWPRAFDRNCESMRLPAVGWDLVNSPSWRFTVKSMEKSI